MYVHPWELDTGQTYSKVTARERITHYHGRRALATKLNQLLNDFEFTTLDNVRRQWLQREDEQTAVDGRPSPEQRIDSVGRSSVAV